MYSPLSTAPLPVTSTHPRGSKCHPGPLDTWPGTVLSFIPAGRPVFVPSGNPHLLGAAMQPPRSADPGTEALTGGTADGGDRCVRSTRTDPMAAITATSTSPAMSE